MVRRYAEPVAVEAGVSLTGSAATPVAELAPELLRYAAWTPEHFVWRGRRYRVRGVLAHWRERRAWWREALDPPARAPQLAGGVAAAARERHVWRVEASAGRQLDCGVFDLACDEDDAGRPLPTGWQLLRIAD
ncbi:MAG TPA: DUF6504 family protein [Dermatophilaceae bacterium]|nr:DUF6504 family protein [Dermatophilaceae bacterium]